MIDKGNYDWYINCTDSSTNHNVGGSAETWGFAVNKTYSESFLNSLAQANAATQAMLTVSAGKLQQVRSSGKFTILRAMRNA